MDLRVKLAFLWTMGVMTMSATPQHQTSQSVRQAKDYLEAIHAVVEEHPVPDFPDAEILGNLEMMQPFKQLVRLSRDNWSELLSNLPVVAPNRQSRVYLLHSFLFLPPGDYIVCISRLLDLYRDGAIKQDEFLNVVLMPPSKQKRWFLSYNYEHPAVKIFLLQVQETFEKDQTISDLVDFILAGKAKARDEILRKHSKSLAKRSIPLLPPRAAERP